MGTAVSHASDLDRLVDGIKDEVGIVTRHLKVLQQFAMDNNCIVGIRPVDKMATALIEHGHPTKNLHIKGKSASWGPQAGMICLDQRFSKLESDPQEAKKFTEQTRQCITNRDAVAVPLTVSRARLDELLAHRILDWVSLETLQGTRKLTAKGPSGEFYLFDAKRTERGGEPFYVITHQGKNLEVLAPRADAKPLTADYDLMVVGPHLRDLGPQDNFRKQDIANGADHDIGISSSRINSMIVGLNKALVGDEGEPLIHHGPDSANPAAAPDTNYPATFALPYRIGSFDELCVIHSPKELATLLQQAKDSGYHVPLNPLWEPEVRSVRRSSYTEARVRVNQELERFVNGRKLRSRSI
ncbi:adenylate cyclase [Trinickia fusca]|uniref:Adenylate cyclase n=2 Tax=Trinickia fusca TaxID=2419777 RepID=A0A494XEW7_9BURK|nr:adenylate cyclase [Trinickia fusca]